MEDAAMDELTILDRMTYWQFRLHQLTGEVLNLTRPVAQQRLAEIDDGLTRLHRDLEIRKQMSA